MQALNTRNTSRHLCLLCLAFPAVGLLGACSSVKIPDIPLPSFITPYRMEIQQGNFITQEMLSQLRPGMTRDQVRFVLGSPLVVDVFHADRWEYVFQRQLEFSKGIEQRRLSVFFENEKLKRLDGDVVTAPSTPTESAIPSTPADKEAVPK